MANTRYTLTTADGKRLSELLVNAEDNIAAIRVDGFESELSTAGYELYNMMYVDGTLDYWGTLVVDKDYKLIEEIIP